MQTAKILLALGEDQGNTVPKRNVTPAEVAVLLAIHGDNAVSELDIQEAKSELVGRELLKDLGYRYGRAVDSDNNSVFRSIFPNANAPVPQTFAEMGLPDAMFTPASLEAMKPKPRKKAAAPKTDDTESTLG